MSTEAGAGLLLSNHSYGTISGWYQTETGAWYWYGNTAQSTTECNNLKDSGAISASATSYSVTGLPRNGSTLSVKFWYRINGIWSFKNYTFQAATL
jgi:hypothetical protein